MLLVVSAASSDGCQSARQAVSPPPVMPQGERFCIVRKGRQTKEEAPLSHCCSVLESGRAHRGYATQSHTRMGLTVCLLAFTLQLREQRRPQCGRRIADLAEDRRRQSFKPFQDGKHLAANGDESGSQGITTSLQLQLSPCTLPWLQAFAAPGPPAVQAAPWHPTAARGRPAAQTCPCGCRLHDVAMRTGEIRAKLQ